MAVLKVGCLYFSVGYREDEMIHPLISTWLYRGEKDGKHLFEGVSEHAKWQVDEENLEFIYDLDGLAGHLTEWAVRCPDLASPGSRGNHLGA